MNSGQDLGVEWEYVDWLLENAWLHHGQKAFRIERIIRIPHRRVESLRAQATIRCFDSRSPDAVLRSPLRSRVYLHPFSFVVQYYPPRHKSIVRPYLAEWDWERLIAYLIENRIFSSGTLHSVLRDRDTIIKPVEKMKRTAVSIRRTFRMPEDKGQVLPPPE